MERLLKATGQRENFSKGAVHSRPFGRSSVLSSLPHSSALTVLEHNKGREATPASLDAACLESVPLRCNQKALRGEMRRRALPVMCCRVNPGPYLESFIKKKEKKKSIQFHKTAEFDLARTRGGKQPPPPPRSPAGSPRTGARLPPRGHQRV